MRRWGSSASPRSGLTGTTRSAGVTRNRSSDAHRPFSGDQQMRFVWCHAIVTVACLAGVLCSAEPPAEQETQVQSLPELVLKQTRPIFDGKTLDGWIQVPPDSWEVKEGVMASKGVGRGVIYTKDDYTKY